MRISDWSSDVCASDLALHYQVNPHFLFNTLNSLSTLVMRGSKAEAEAMIMNLSAFLRSSLEIDPEQFVSLDEEIALQRIYQIGRASCRERVCQYVSISVVAVSLKKKNE